MKKKIKLLLLIVTIKCILNNILYVNCKKGKFSNIKFNTSFEQFDSDDDDETKSNDPFVIQMKFYQVSCICLNFYLIEFN